MGLSLCLLIPLSSTFNKTKEVNQSYSHSLARITVERIWPEVNHRINYPIKRLLLDMENNGEIDMGEETTKFCVSWITIWAMQGAVKDFIQAWNTHRIPGPQGGVPSFLAMYNSCTTLLPPGSVPEIIELHEDTHVPLTQEARYGCDPLDANPHLQELCEHNFLAAFPSSYQVFEDVLHGSGQL